MPMRMATWVAESSTIAPCHMATASMAPVEASSPPSGHRITSPSGSGHATAFPTTSSAPAPIRPGGDHPWRDFEVTATSIGISGNIGSYVTLPSLHLTFVGGDHRADDLTSRLVAFFRSSTRPSVAIGPAILGDLHLVRPKPRRAPTSSPIILPPFGMRTGRSSL